MVTFFHVAHVREVLLLLVGHILLFGRLLEKRKAARSTLMVVQKRTRITWISFRSEFRWSSSSSCSDLVVIIRLPDRFSSTLADLGKNKKVNSGGKVWRPLRSLLLRALFLRVPVVCLDFLVEE